MKKFFTFSFLAFALVSLFACSSAPANPTSVAEEAVECMQNSDFEGLTDLFYFDEAKPEDAAKGKQMLTGMFTEKMAPDIEKKGGIASFETIKEEISEKGDSAKVDVEVTYGNGTKDTENMKLTKKNDKWFLEFGK